MSYRQTIDPADGVARSFQLFSSHSYGSMKLKNSFVLTIKPLSLALNIIFKQFQYN